jgi:hypothetical protein
MAWFLILVFSSRAAISIEFWGVIIVISILALMAEWWMNDGLEKDLERSDRGPIQVLSQHAWRDRKTTDNLRIVYVLAAIRTDDLLDTSVEPYSYARQLSMQMLRCGHPNLHSRPS